MAWTGRLVFLGLCILGFGCSENTTTPSGDDTAAQDSGAMDTTEPADTPEPLDLADTTPPEEDTIQPTPDTAPIPPDDPYAIETLLQTWYDNFNENTDQSYLTADYDLLADGSPEHTKALPHEAYLDVPYGPYSRNRLDFYRAKEVVGVTPVAVFIHGGGYTNGDKDQVHTPTTDIDRFLKDGISVASIVYRWAYKDSAKALGASKPNDIGDKHNVNGTRLDYIMRDCARAIQFLRYKAAEWGIDKSRIGAYGGSAGAACAMWVATIPDLANPTAADPVLRESTHLTVVGHNNSQVTMDFTKWPELLDLPEDFVFSMIGEKAQGLNQMTIEDQDETVPGKELCSILDYYEHLGPDGPAIYSSNGKEDSDETTITSSSEVIHHPRGHVALHERCVAMGLECAIKTPILDSGYQGDLIKFMIEQLNKP